MIILYSISRTEYAKLASILMIVMFPINIYANILSGTSLSIAATLNFLIPSYILISIWFSIVSITIFGLLNAAFMLTLPYLVPEIVPKLSIILGPLAVSVIVMVLLVVAKKHHNQIEIARQLELRSAYDATLEGWSRVLELRDEETGGHSQRVTTLVLELAQELGISGQDLDHIRRGALLHDIGKMGVPDDVLHKPSSLTDDEFEIIKQHPGFAYELLFPISFLHKALEIPYCHHEKWDGSGYPQGLKGEKIPISARIFAVVDVWDALLSDRPYRNAWPKEKGVNYIIADRGKHFDPHITDTFLQIRETTM
ncbi:MAG: HD domain-containing protein [Chloroflexi bacterium]|nr:HD domain-containing protein [Chloroflexota bacterium]